MIVLDTSLLVAWTNRHDVHHAAAGEFMQAFLGGAWGRGILLEYVMQEFVTVVQRRIDHATAVRTAEVLRSAKELQFVDASGRFERTLEVFTTQGQHGLSFVDAAVVAAAKEFAGGRIASFDNGFEAIAGVTRLP